MFRDESGHISFAFEVIRTVREEEPELFDDELSEQILTMLTEAVDWKMVSAQDVLSWGVAGLSIKDMREYLEYVADQRLAQLGLAKHFNSRNPFPFMDLQDVQELTDFFERRVFAYQVGIAGYVAFHRAFDTSSVAATHHPDITMTFLNMCIWQELCLEWGTCPAHRSLNGAKL